MKANFGEFNYPSRVTEETGTCAHVRKTYRDTILTSHPPQHPWICPDCFQEGAEMKWSSYKNPVGTYEEIQKRKRESLNG